MAIKMSYSLLSFDLGRKIELDLGCGEGSFTIELAKKFPNSVIIAVDTMKGRLEKLNKKARLLNLDNILIVESEAAFFLEIMLPESCLDRIHLLCPDPWPKRKHRCHRLVTSEFASLLSRKLRPDGIFHFSSDDEAYCASVKRIILADADFSPPSDDLIDIQMIRSDFEKQWLSQGKNVEHLFWEKKAKQL
jgi:tRNA (guanine-N7-)-methyltransferase